ncbi:PAS domain-containing protein [Flavobacterium sp. SUN046]|uniref:PAS domain S-box protein n=1 Tax=Flavobacterium sp. SUN046 TaxID=3002440 RepID=UPI002DBC3D3A|nr:PAS domain-containing protein [Flavobacterium sp. SUN046]MEC4048482.1 PAS domain-containing protein [Flavobacterium sp. SUN046]
MKKIQLNFDDSSFNRLFPFYIILDSDLNIKGIGKSLSKILPNLKENNSFTTSFTLTRPQIENLSKDNFKEVFSQLVILDSIEDASISLRGQFELQDNCYFFVGSPWFTSMNEVVNKNLTVNDFANHDSVLDLLHLLNDQATTNTELKELLNTVNNQRIKHKKDKEELDRLSLVASANKNGVVLTHPDGKIFWCNDAYLKLTGYTLDEVIGLTPIQIGQCEETSDVELQNIRRAFYSSDSFLSEINHNTKSGKPFWARIIGQSIFDENGEINQYFAIFEDATLEKEKEDQLRLLSSLAEHNSNAVIISNNEGVIEWVNSNVSKMSGYTKEELIGKKPVQMFSGPDTNLEAIEYIKNNAQKGLPFKTEIYNYTKEKKGYWKRVQGHPFKDKEGKVLKIFIVEEDITHEKEKEQQLHLLSSIVRENINGVLIMDKDWKIEWVNSSFEKMTGYSKEELVGFAPFNIFNGELTDKKTIEYIKNQRENGLPFNCELLSYKKNGESFWKELYGQPLLDTNGKVIKYFTIEKDVTEDKLKEQQVKLLSTITREAKNAIIITDKEGRTEWVNNSFIEMTGYSNVELIGKKPGDILQGPETNPETIKYMSDQLKNDLSFSCEILNYAKTGEKYWVRILSQPILDKEGKVIKFFSIEEDITNAKLMDQQLVESEERMSSLIVNLNSAILLEDENRKILLTNKKFCQIFDIPLEPEMMKGFDCTSAADETKHFFKYPELFVKRIDEILLKKEKVESEELELVDGRILERTFIPIIRGNEYKGHLWSYEDITINRNYRESIIAEREKYSRIIANMNLGLIEVDQDEIIKYANHSFSEMTGYTIPELIGSKASDLLLEKQDEEILISKKQARNQGVSDLYEVNAKIKNGVTRNWLISGAPNYDVTGEIIGSIGIHLDITNQKVLERQKEQLLKKLEKQNEQLNDYAQIVSHDLKSPLRSIHSLISWIKEDNDKAFNEETAEYFRLMQAKVEKMDSLIEGILTYSKIDDVHVDIENVNLNELVTAVINTIDIPKHIRVVINNSLPIIKANRTREFQVFQNLIANAVNYNDKEQGLIEIGCEEFSNEYIFYVKDNGPGIKKENQFKIFKMFQSFHNDERSTGIGLSIVKKILENNNERIWLESQLTIGTTFYFTFKK